MEVEELIKLKKELQQIYEIEEKEYNPNNEDNEIIEEELKDIKKEQIKVDKLIEIYKREDKGYIVMKLERLYMMLVSNLNELEFNSLNEEQMFEIFDNYFPKEWTYKYSIEEKENILLNAICKNRIINTQNNNKNK